jgi:hypothetical protein
LLDFILAFHGLGNLDGVLDLVALLGFLPGLALSGVKNVGHLGVSAINCSVLKTTAVCL